MIDKKYIVYLYIFIVEFILNSGSLGGQILEILQLLIEEQWHVKWQFKGYKKTN